MSYQIFGKTEFLTNKTPLTLTFGNFDGVHLGHQFIIQNLLARAAKGPTAVVTFNPPPSSVLNPQKAKPLLYDIQTRIKELLQENIDIVIVANFTKKFAELSADEFCSEFLASNFNIANIILGYNLQYGKNAQGNFKHLQQVSKKYNWEVIQLPEFKIGPDIVSSSKIRDLLVEGDLELANSLLGRDYCLTGKVIHGDKRGRTLKFPTANMQPTVNSLLKPGVYFTKLKLLRSNIEFNSVTSCGFRPTFGANLEYKIESYILNFDADIYDSEISLTFLKYLRDEINFADVEQLKLQMHADIEKANMFFL